EHHQERDYRRAGVDNQLPGIRETEDGTCDRPADDHDHGQQKSPRRTGPNRGFAGEPFQGALELGWFGLRHKAYGASTRMLRAVFCSPSVMYEAATRMPGRKSARRPSFSPTRITVASVTRRSRAPPSLCTVTSRLSTSTAPILP